MVLFLLSCRTFNHSHSRPKYKDMSNIIIYIENISVILSINHVLYIHYGTWSPHTSLVERNNYNGLYVLLCVNVIKPIFINIEIKVPWTQAARSIYVRFRVAWWSEEFYYPDNISLLIYNPKLTFKYFFWIKLLIKNFQDMFLMYIAQINFAELSNNIFLEWESSKTG